MNKTLDGIRKIPKKPQKKRQTKIKLSQNLKLAVAILATFVLTFLVSVASSRILAQPQGEVLGASTESQNSGQGPDPAIAVTSEPKQDLAFDNIVLTEPATVFLPEENISAPDPLINREDFLKQYLSTKNSPLAAHVSAISAQSQWKLIVAIAQAESSSCKKYPEHSANCWGVGGASNLMQFSNLDAAIAHVNQLLEQKYISQGLSSPDKLVKKWVGHQNDQWEQAVQEVLDSLKNVQ